MSRIELLRQIVAESQARKISIQDSDGKNHKVYVDMTTANLLVRIYDALNDANRAKFITLPWPKMVNVAWKLATPKA